MPRRKKEPMFEDRVRFNWGFHDAVSAVRHGRAVPERNFGFGPALDIKEPADVLIHHQDRAYAEGWTRGHYWQTHNLAVESSEAAWNHYQVHAA